MSQLVKTLNGLAIASVKTRNGLAIASAKTINGLDNTSAGGGDITTGLVAWWKFDEGSLVAAADSSGNLNTATLTNGATWTTGKIGPYALLLDGVDDYALAADAASLNLERTSPHSIGLWVYLDSDISNNSTLFTKMQTFGNSPGVQLSVDVSNLRLRYFIIDSAGNAIGATGGVNSFTSLATWRHVVVTYDGSSSGAGLLVYVDSVFQFAGTGSVSSSILNAFGVYMGAETGGGAQRLKGRLDDVRYYNRALSQTDIDALFAYV